MESFKAGCLVMSIRDTALYSSDVGLSVCSSILNAIMLTISMRTFFVMPPFSRASVVARENLSGSLKVCTQVEDVLVIALMALLLGDYVKKYRTM